MRRNPIEAAVWDEIAAFGARILVFHPDEGSPADRFRYGQFLREGLARGRLAPLRALPEGRSQALVFRLAGAAERP
jgi:hypothetical protein